MENNNQYTIDKLHHLVSICEDGKAGYENAAEDVKDSDVQNLFMKISKERASYAMQLRNKIFELGGKSENSGEGGALGSIHRLWIDMKATFTSGDKDSIIKACTTGEEAAIKSFKEAIDDDKVSVILKQLITEQLHGIERALSSIKMYEVHTTSKV